MFHSYVLDFCIFVVFRYGVHIKLRHFQNGSTSINVPYNVLERRALLVLYGIDLLSVPYNNSPPSVGRRHRLLTHARNFPGSLVQSPVLFLVSVQVPVKKGF
jgi:hypothetical protein